MAKTTARIYNIEDWIETPGFVLVKNYPELCVNTNKNHFVMMTLNPGGLVSKGDQTFQVLRYFCDNLEDEEIMEYILEEQISHATMAVDASSAGRLIKKLLGFEYVKFEKHPTVQEFFDCCPSGIGMIVVRIGNRVELFNTDDGKFYGCHEIQYTNKVVGYWRKKES